MFPVSLDCPMFCLPSVSTEDIEVRQNIGQSRDTGNIRNTRHRSKKNSTTDNLETLETSGTEDVPFFYFDHSIVCLSSILTIVLCAFLLF
jgi:hypothetical protein